MCPSGPVLVAFARPGPRQAGASRPTPCLTSAPSHKLLTCLLYSPCLLCCCAGAHTGITSGPGHWQCTLQSLLPLSYQPGRQHRRLVLLSTVCNLAIFVASLNDFTLHSLAHACYGTVGKTESAFMIARSVLEHEDGNKLPLGMLVIQYVTVRCISMTSLCVNASCAQTIPRRCDIGRHVGLNGVFFSRFAEVMSLEVKHLLQVPGCTCKAHYTPT